MKLSEIKVGMTVWHLSFGSGKVITANKDSCIVSFINEPLITFADYMNELYNPDALYPHPVTVIAESEVTRLNELVKVQKELIRELDKQISSESLHMDDLEYAESIRNKISKLEKNDK